MAKKKEEAVEGEIVSDSEVKQSYSYKQYASKPADSALVWVWTFSLVALIFSIIPIIGLGLCVLALILCLIKETPPVLPIIGIIIGGFTTSIFLLFWLVLKAIF